MPKMPKMSESCRTGCKPTDRYRIPTAVTTCDRLPDNRDERDDQASWHPGPHQFLPGLPSHRSDSHHGCGGAYDPVAKRSRMPSHHHRSFRIRYRVMLLLMLLVPTTIQAAEPDAVLASPVRPTEPLTPDEQRQRFHLPPGFEIQLVASEPAIQKPMNLAFDTRGRLWVSGSVEYPYAAAPGQGRDSIRILEAISEQGRAEKVTTFVSGLNIPIGLYPYRDGVITYSIPDIRFYRDTNGDGVSDQSETLFANLGEPADTHGMQNAFRRGLDGWLYINHGFRNQSTIVGRDGSRLELNSGNTYRVRLDGSRVEPISWGQVNPFGSTWLPTGDLLNTDCHSKPLSLILRGGYYSSFGKPHDGLGFVPPVMEHGHGSTALAGAAFCDSPAFPAEYQGCLFLGNVMTCRVHRDRLERRGSSWVAVEQEDFLRCDDPWFRPVDMQMGPDGALYIADFYNRIIGHYEVALDHPGRDRERGRIWRVVYRGIQQASNQVNASANPMVSSLNQVASNNRRTNQPSVELIGADGVSVATSIDEQIKTGPSVAIHSSATTTPGQATVAATERREIKPEGNQVTTSPLDLTQAQVSELLQELESPSLTRRYLATDELSDRIGLAGLDELRAAIRRATSRPSQQTGTLIHGTWVLHRLGQLRAADLSHLSKSESPLVRMHAMRMCSEQKTELDTVGDLVRAGLRDSEPGVRRAAADASGQLADPQAVQVLLTTLHETVAADVHLRHALRMALRNQLRVADTFSLVEKRKLTPLDQAALADVALGVASPAAADYLLRHLEIDSPDATTLAARLEHIAAQTHPDRIAPVVKLVREHAQADLTRQLAMLQALQQRVTQRGLPIPNELRSWGVDLVSELLKSLSEPRGAWRNLGASNPWDWESRRVANESQPRLFLSSLPGGELQTSRLQSPAFPLPAQLRFLLCGHRGAPNQPASDANYVQICLAASGKVLSRAYPPRNDTAEAITWDFSQHVGESVYLELVDGIAESGYAWLAVTGFDPPVVTLPPLGPRALGERQRAVASLAASLQLTEFLPQLRDMVIAPPTDREARVASARACQTLAPHPLSGALLPVLQDSSIQQELRLLAANCIATPEQTAPAATFKTVFQRVSSGLQQAVAFELASHRTGAELLLQLVEQGAASPRLLQNPTLQSRLKGTDTPRVEEQIARLTDQLPPPAAEIERLLKERRERFAQQASDPEAGRLLFEKHCANCHQRGGRGAIIGPQLDGIGQRGLERVLEDVLDPNRNIDAAFHLSVVVLNNGRVVTGLFRRREDRSLIFAGNDGKEFAVLEAEIDQRQVVRSSLMPDNFATTLQPAEFQHLIAYLLTP